MLIFSVSILVILTVAGSALVGCVVWPKLRLLIHKHLAQVIAEVAERHEHDVSLALLKHATDQSAEFVAERMNRTGNVYPDRFGLLAASLQMVEPKPGGLYCEFGVYQGTTINFIADHTESVVHGFDSFEGLPEYWRAGFREGRFKMNTLPEVRGNVQLHKGWFETTLRAFKAAYEGPLVFVHFDADLYTSTKVVFEALGDRVVPGTVLQFDEYFNYPSWKDGEHKAFEEFRMKRNVEVEFVGYAREGEQVAMKVVRIDAG
jgi:hypothetical protein